MIEVTNRIALLADLREWNELRECFCDQVEVDYTSEFGGQPQYLTVDELLEQWNFLKEFQSTQHQVTCHMIALIVVLMCKPLTIYPTIVVKAFG